MGVGERRAREKARVRIAILDAALAIATTKGWEAVTIRAIAERIEFSPAAIYEHFAGKADILSEAALRGLRTLADALASDAGVSNEGRLERFAATVWSWAFANPMLFQLLHTGRIFTFGTAATPSEARAVFALARDVVAASAPHSDLDDKTDLLWASLSGLILLTMFDRVAGGQARAEKLRDRMIADLRSAWEGGPRGSD
jgi:AcrR family transcriptional regulator